ncbi:hypothetical protein QQ045_004022 [Rhodiola kirilowii]
MQRVGAVARDDDWRLGLVLGSSWTASGSRCVHYLLLNWWWLSSQLRKDPCLESHHHQTQRRAAAVGTQGRKRSCLVGADQDLLVGEDGEGSQWRKVTLLLVVMMMDGERR